MAYRKITLLIDCDSDQEKELVQNVADEVSNMRLVTGRQLLSIYPILRDNKSDFINLFRLATGPKGPMGLVSIDGAKLLSKLTKIRR